MAVTTPSVPATTVPVTNPTGQFVSVVVTGGTMTNVSVNGVTVGTGAGTYQLPPGGSISMTYSVAPTWAWSNPIDLAPTPGYYAENTQAEASGWNPYTALPYAQHATLGVTGLATGVSN